jgi:septal ring-binding cell division protein DamX
MTDAGRPLPGFRARLRRPGMTVRGRHTAGAQFHPPRHSGGAQRHPESIGLVYNAVPLNALQQLLVVLSLLLFIAGTSHADYQSGLDAYHQGDYINAMRAWKAVAALPSESVHPAIYSETFYAIGMLYWQGEGVTKDYFQAANWIRSAAELNHAGAQTKLAYLYSEGWTVDQDYDQAFQWFEKAAKQGDVDGQYNLGIFYLNGWGTEQDSTMAAQWLAAASAQGDESAEEALQQVLGRSALARDELNVGDLAQTQAKNRPQAGSYNVEPQSPGQTGSQQSSSAHDSESAQAPTSQQSEAAQLQSPRHSGSAQPSPGSTGHPSKNKSILEVASQPGAFGADWILEQDPEHYTIQVMALSSLEKLQSLIAKHHDMAHLAIYELERNDRPLYVLTQGIFTDVESARTARDDFPRSLNRPDRVWIRKFGMIQELIIAEGKVKP